MSPRIAVPRPALVAVLVAALAASLGACDALDNAQPPPPKERIQKMNAYGNVMGDDGFLFGGPKKKDDGSPSGGGIGVNSFLWRASLDSMGFMPLASADPFGGVIITDWYTPPGTTGERFKATVYILSRDLRSDGIRVNIYRQVLQNGQWMDATVSDSTAGDIENKVLARARHMREQLQASS